MRDRFMLGLIIKLTVPFAIATLEFNMASSLASTTPKPTVQSLSNGDYFYGESRYPNISGARYVIFRKIGRTVTGRNYIYGSNEWACFRGTANGTQITNITSGTIPIPSGKESLPWEFSPSVAINVSVFSRLLFNQATPTVKQGFQTCLQLFQHRR